MKLFSGWKKKKKHSKKNDNDDDERMMNLSHVANKDSSSSAPTSNMSLYQYAMNEYSHTVNPQYMDENGWEISQAQSSGYASIMSSSQSEPNNATLGMRKRNNNNHSYHQYVDPNYIQNSTTNIPSINSSPGRKTSEPSERNNNKTVSFETDTSRKESTSNSPSDNNHIHFQDPNLRSNLNESPSFTTTIIPPSELSSSCDDSQRSPHFKSDRMHRNFNSKNQPNNRYTNTEPIMPDATYEEIYGDTYVNAPIKYIYPSGYQNMRPRSGPWKMSIFICILFTWLTVFIVGHCSDRADMSFYNYEIDDDMLVIETKWCGSQLLYFMWVISIVITALATAYCSVIGYIQVRDFAVANCRSQPPGMVGKSDYYVRIEDGNFEQHHNNDYPDDHDGSDGGYHPPTYQSGRSTYQKSIYQSDGTPQFWGSHIYKPNQAAVAVTSR